MQTTQVASAIDQMLDVKLADTALVAPTFDSIGSVATVVDTVEPGTE